MFHLPDTSTILSVKANFCTLEHTTSALNTIRSILTVVKNICYITIVPANSKTSKALVLFASQNVGLDSDESTFRFNKKINPNQYFCVCVYMS